MCKCTPEIRTPFCGKPGCEWPNKQKPDNARGNDMTTDFDKRIERLSGLRFYQNNEQAGSDIEWAVSELKRLKPLEVNGIDLANIVQEQDAELVLALLQRAENTLLRRMIKEIRVYTGARGWISYHDEDIDQFLKDHTAALNNRSDEDGP